MRARLTALDGLRGLAAVVVVVFHETNLTWPAHGYLAVDLFFMLSGYVLAGAFEQRLREGLTWLRFMRERMARLYPIYVVGLTLGLAGSWLLDHEIRTALLGDWAANLAFVGRGGFRLDPPMWSLALEVIAGAAFAGGAWRLPNWGLAAMAAVGAVWLVLGGVSSENGFARVLFAFPAGWLLWRVRERVAPLVGRRAPVIALVAIAASWVLPGADLPVVLVLYPLAVLGLALGAQPTGRLAEAATLLGGVSYPLYAVHAAVIPLTWLIVPGLPVGLAAALLVAWALHRTVEPAGRRLILAGATR